MSGVEQALMALAACCRAYSGEHCGDLLSDTWDVLGPVVRWSSDQAGRFGRLIDAEGFTDAALMLVPVGMHDEIEITTLYLVARVTINMNHGPDGSPFYGSNECNSLPLALADAALRAHAAALPLSDRFGAGVER